MLNSIAKSVCLTLALTASSSVTAFALFKSLFGSEPKHAQTIVIAGKEYSTAELPNIHADTPRQECSLIKNKDLIESSIDKTVTPIRKATVQSHSDPGIPLVALIQKGDAPVTLEIRTSSSIASEYSVDTYATHPLIAHLMEQLQTVEE